MFNLKAGVQFNEHSENKEFILGAGTQTEVFSVPVKLQGKKLSYGIYFKTGRSIWLDSVYVSKKGDVVTLTTDKQVYNPGENVQIKIESTQAGALSITGPNYSESLEISVGITTLSFVLGEMIAGTQTISYSFAGVSYSYPIDIAGYQVQILEAKLDKVEPNIGEQVPLSLTANSNSDITPVIIKAWLIEPNGTTIEVINENTYLVKGENKFSYAWTVSTESTGIHRLIYAMYDNTEMLLVSGAKSFDVGKAVLLGLTTDKEEYTTITEPVDAKVTLYGKQNEQGILTIYLDGNYINSQNIVWTGSTEELIISIPVVQAGCGIQ